MWCDNNIGQTPQRMIFRKRLWFDDIEGCTSEFATFQGRNQIFSDNTFTTTNIDKISAGLKHFKKVFIKQIIGSRR